MAEDVEDEEEDWEEVVEVDVEVVDCLNSSLSCCAHLGSVSNCCRVNRPA